MSQTNEPLVEQVVERCAKCKFWLDLFDDTGLCRRRSPIVAATTESLFRSWAFAEDADEPDDWNFARQGIWPVTHKNDCCGEFVLEDFTALRVRSDDKNAQPPE